MSARLLWILGSSIAGAALADGPAPQLFAPGVISSAASEASPVFMPDGRTVLFTRSNGADYDILVSHRAHAAWSAPVIASFSGEWRDLEASIAPDGSYLVFASSRPLPGTSVAPDGIWNGSTHAGKGGNLWRVERTREGWSTPVRLPEIINRNASTFSPAVTADGTLYFMQVYGDAKRFHLFRAARSGTGYAAPEALPFTDDSASDVDPAVAADDSFLIFSSTRAPAAAGQLELFIVFRDGETWGSPQHLPERINALRPITEARLGPDRHTLYFTSSFVEAPAMPKTAATARRSLQGMQGPGDGNGHIWQVDIADVIATSKPGVGAADRPR
jgi:hypothetical protein